jgi:hypothetical protein
MFRDAVLDQGVSSITVLSRRALPGWVTENLPQNNKTSTIIIDDFLKYSSDLPPMLASHDACIWALGCSSVGMNEKDYTKITFDYTEAFISALQSGDLGKSRADKDPFRMVWISGASVDENSPTMFRRVKVTVVLLPLYGL